MTLAIPRLDRTTAEERGLTIADFLVPIRVGERVNARVRHVVLILIGVLIVAVCAQIYIPTTPVPFTGQTFAVLAVGGALGFRRGAMSLALYVLLGAVGLPIFAQSASGVSVVLGTSGGYLIGFVLAAAAVGRLAELGWDRNIAGSLGAMLIGSVLIYTVGLPWLGIVGKFSLQDTIAFGLTPFLAWDAAKLAVAAAIFPAAWWIVGRRPDDR
ncbi:MAG: biotin transport system substrate-specific component [Chloroflexota bacterium]|jgi:biotin transport system substrate-specific component|nr:biotin transport system substrate-specific component [Chloroflexota bacterium]